MHWQAKFLDEKIGMQKCRSSGVQKGKRCKSAKYRSARCEVQECWSAEEHECRSVGPLEGRMTGGQECRSAGVIE
jgi:hypothetical protein